MTQTHEHAHAEAPVFAYEEVPATVDAVENETGDVLRAAEKVAEDVETVDLASMSDEERLAFFRKLADDNAKLRREAAELKTALTKASTGTTRTKKDSARDHEWFGAAIAKVVTGETFRFSTEKNPTGGYRYVGTVEVPAGEGKTRRVHFTVVAKDARRG